MLHVTIKIHFINKILCCDESVSHTVGTQFGFDVGNCNLTCIKHHIKKELNNGTLNQDQWNNS